MNKLLLVLFLVFCGYKSFQQFGPKATVEPLMAESYVAVYGRTTCEYTNHAIRKLQQSGVNYQFMSVDDRDSADLLHTRMASSGISTRRYDLPVVDVNGDLNVRPDISDVLSLYHSKL